MSIPQAAHLPRPVQVQFLQTSTLVEYVPANIERPRAQRAEERMNRATAQNNLPKMCEAAVDYLAEVLTGWSFNPGKPTRAALGNMPGGWLGAALTALAADATEAAKEFER